jgi:hypothetical protein
LHWDDDPKASASLIFMPQLLKRLLMAFILQKLITRRLMIPLMKQNFHRLNWQISCSSAAA